MRVELFDFDLPPSAIAHHPAQPKDSARLLEITEFARRGHIVRELPYLLRTGDLLIFNDTRVIPARLKGKRGTASVEVTLHKYIAPGTWRAFAKPARKLAQGDKVTFSDSFSATVTEKGEEGEVTLQFFTDTKPCDDTTLLAYLKQHGAMPLPPYIKRTDPQKQDESDYQTLFARQEGAVAAPTAGLHFTPQLMEALAAKGIEHAFVTLHVGAGTFLPVKVDDTDQHVMHSEWYSIPEATAAHIRRTREAGGRIIAVGTTSLRTLEAAAAQHTEIRACKGDTDIFITPGYRFRAVDMLFTNFHLPRSTLFMLVCAFAGTDRMKQAYSHAINHGYRFYSYGDACLLERENFNL